MPVQEIIDEYKSEIVSLDNQVSSLGTLVDPLQLKINRFINPVAQLDLEVCNLTVKINQKIYDIGIVANNANACGCGSTATRTEVIYDSVGAIVGVTTTTYTIGNYYYYEQVKAHRINAENTSYTGTDPYGPYFGTDGSTTFTTGIGYATTVNGIDNDSITSLTITNPGYGYTPGTYYRQELTGEIGTGGLVDIIVGSGGTIITSVIVNNGGTGYQTNQSVGVLSFPGASFNISRVGSPILGVGTDTYIVASSGVGSVFVPTVSSGNVSICSTSCATYSSQFTILSNDLSSLRAKRDSLLSGTNHLKTESKKMYVQRYGFVFAQGDLNSRKSTVNSIIGTLSDSTYGDYFV
jgi:hypothetical protein